MSSEQPETHELSARRVLLQEIPTEKATGKDLVSGNMNLIKDLKVKLSVSVGGAELTVAELFSLKDDSVLKLDSATDDPVEVLLEGKVIARGDLVAVGDKFGVSITEVLPAPGT